MSLQVLISTMEQEDHKLLKRMNLSSEAVVINQIQKESIETVTIDSNVITWINSTKRGLSVSRNMALQNASAEICLLADDDEVFIDDYKKIILEQFEKNPQYDIITFQVEGIEREFKRYSPKERSLGFLYSMKVSSVEIAFRLDRIKEKGIKFNERFGAGGKYFAGEENIFLYDCLRAGLKIKYVPIKIADLHIGESSWFKGYNEEYFIAKGAIFTAMSKRYSKFLIWQFALRKHDLYRKEMGFRKALKKMLQGRLEYLKRHGDRKLRNAKEL